MYFLGNHFKRDIKQAISNPNNIIKGQYYRITILSDSLYRFEYNPKGIFEDRPTLLAWFRNTAPVQFKKVEVNNKIKIITKYAKISYIKEKKFLGTKINPSVNLKVELLNSKRIWYYKHPEIRNLGGPSLEMQNKDGKLQFGKSLFSLDGFVSIDDSKNQVIDENGCLNERDNEEIDVYLFVYGNDFKLGLKDYYNLTGYPTLIPRYALGNWWIKNETYTQNQIINLVEKFNENNIPLSVLILDNDWHIRPNKNNKLLKTGFSFNANYINDPYSLIKKLNENNIKLGLTISPLEGFYDCDPVYKETIKYLKPDKKGIIPFNVLNQRLIDVYLKFYIHPLDNSGITLFYLDCNDPKKINTIAMLQYYHFMDIKRLNKRPLLLSYNTFIAQHRYSITYSGKSIVNWQTLKQIPLYNGMASNSGISWCSQDIGGYYKGIEDNELYIRFIQLGVFGPIMKFGSDKGKYYRREPWLRDIKTQEIIKRYLQLRNRLIPYLYNEAFRYSSMGELLIKPIYYKYPKYYDDDLFKNEYYFGTEFFITPILKKKDYVMNRVIHKFYLPEGNWYEFINGKKFKGDRKYISFYRDQEYPVFVKEGAIIPLNGEYNDINLPKKMEIQIFPGNNNIYELYEDNGENYDYIKGLYVITTFKYIYDKDNYKLEISPKRYCSNILPETRDYIIKFRNTNNVQNTKVIVNSKEVEFKSYQKENDHIIEFKNISTNSNIEIICQGKNLNVDAVQLLSKDFEDIIGDLQIETSLKEKVDEIIFDDKPFNKKRIAIRKLVKKGLERKYVDLFLKLLEYLEQV